ncbi:DNA replication/repair protein RecF [Pseudoflavitalea rhizosphaerae]|uniref:DNA replication/repair protein RecF n=1 Tax=Pseudoflavitalea rhizosphaerae TaxID=1884793 RepID=UPI001F49549F|nr:DNA replication and repair protein RecF [Pseudoflavitalea rhizosphaerae]
MQFGLILRRKRLKVDNLYSNFDPLLFLHSISLVQFKNYTHREFDFSERIVGICGRNGVGKTNLLDAIYYCCFTKSYFGRSDNSHVQHGSSGFRLVANMELQGRKEEAVCILRENGKKEFYLEGELYEKFARHVGRYPCVIIAPDDIRIIMEGSEERRRFTDALLSQLDGFYLTQLIDYNRVLQQRNGFLKSMAEKNIRDTGLLDVYDQQLIQFGEYVFSKRKEFLAELIPSIKNFYKQIAATDEELDLEYESQLLKESFPQLLQRMRQKDILLQRTNAGVHKDDLDIMLKQQAFKNLASQGQRKSLLFAMKLAEFELLKKHKGFTPLLLLDDVFEKLDEHRMHNLLAWVCVQNDGQIFLTDTHEERIRNHFDALKQQYQVISLQEAE